MKLKYLLLFAFWLASWAIPTQAQVDTTVIEETLTVIADTVEVQKEVGQGFFAYDENNLPIPKKSLIYSFVLPGMGQAYNRKWWKLPFVYGAVGAIIYGIDFNQGIYRNSRDCLVSKLAGLDCENELYNSLSTNTLTSIRDTYDRNTQLSYMGALAIYGVIAIEAFTDGHLQSFDISDDLSLKVQPSFDLDPVFARPTIGVSFVVKFDK